MTCPRSHLVDPSGGIYHVNTRCVRKAFLCGKSKTADKSYDHRRQWIVDRMLHLTQCFAVDVLAYAIMSNHYHALLNVHPDIANAWADGEVARRWVKLHPRKSDTPTNIELRRQQVLASGNQLSQARKKLGSLSWFMKHLNQNISRRANIEDDCTGHFWQGRFHSQQVLDEDGVLATMTYIDLNPVRAGIDKDPCLSVFTSLSERLKHWPHELKPINEPYKLMPIGITIDAYRDLVRSIGEINNQAKSLGSAGIPPPIAHLLKLQPKPGRWQRAIGNKQQLKSYAARHGLKWIRTYGE